MKIHEYRGIELFKKAGIPVLEGAVASDVKSALSIASQIGYPVVLKAQVLVGGRGKAGGVKIIKDAEELSSRFNEIKKLIIKGYSVEQILIVKALNIQKEYYVAITIDNTRSDVVLIGSAQGGVDIEEVAKTNPQAIHKLYLQNKKYIDQSQLLEFLKLIFKESSSQDAAAKILQNLAKLFFEYDCSLAEINPLVMDDQKRWYAADAKINFDDNALFRHPQIEALQDFKYEDPEEVEAKKNGLSFVKMDGNVGCIVNGAGLAMATMDIIKLCGGNPANFLDVGGSSNPQKVLNALKIILKNKNVKSLLINIFGGITRCDDIAKGILEAKEQLEMKVPLVVRLTGTNEKEAKDLLAKSEIKTYSSMREAVEEAVRMAR